MKLKNIGGIASIAITILLLIFISVWFMVFPRHGIITISDWLDPIKYFDAMGASPSTFFIINLVMILCSIAYVLFVLALWERMQASAPNLMRAAAIAVSITCTLWIGYALIGIVGMPPIVNAKDPSAFRAVMAIYSAIGTAGDNAAGWVLLLIGWAALKTGKLPKMLSCVSILKGFVMIIEFSMQSLQFIGMLLGLLLYLWLGIVLLRSKD